MRFKQKQPKTEKHQQKTTNQLTMTIQMRIGRGRKIFSLLTLVAGGSHSYTIANGRVSRVAKQHTDRLTGLSPTKPESSHKTGDFRLRFFSRFSRIPKMIDPTNEMLMSLPEICSLLPPGRNGSKPHLNTVLRWVLKGVRLPSGECVRLGASRCGSKWISSREALARFMAALTPNLDTDPPTARTPTARKRAVERAEKNLEKIGI
jgi:hypothetical protein